MRVNIFLEREMSPTSGRVDCEAAQPSRCCRWHTLGVNSGANSAPINQLIRPSRHGSKSCYMRTPRTQSHRNFAGDSAKNEKEKDIQGRDSNIYNAAMELRGCRASTTASRTLQIAHSGEEPGVVAHAGPRCQQIIPPMNRTANQ